MSVEYVPLRYVTSVLARGTAPNYVEDGPVRMVSQAANQDSGLEWERTRFHDFAGDPRKLKGYLEFGDSLVNSTGTGTLGRVGWFEKSPDHRPCVADGHVTVTRFDSTRVDKRFGFYYLKSDEFQEFMFETLVNGSTNQIELSRERMSAVSMPVPPLEEQRRIADFLDAETTRIDKLMHLRKRHLDLLEERRVAYLRNCATGQLDAASKGDDQELDWLGRIPSSWKIVNLGRVSRVIMGTTFPHRYQGKAGGDYPFVKVADFDRADKFGFVADADNWISADVAEELGARIVPSGSVLYARVGAALLLNRRLIASRDCVVDDNVRALSFKEGDPRYWRTILSLLDMGQIVNPGPVPSVGETQVSMLRVPNPDSKLQRRIANELDRFVLAQDRMRQSISRQISLLAERRQALITAAVTGEFDVSAASGRGIEE
ncbi:restriction endonuclease S subunit [Saccharomonospora marina XMU15]|uniref:Restriction endonuclease S subunit n=1 Tax=Saccharomonospora marina XMU15 TaxID=882083 RepID=H5WWN7_9PSEU|nr:restriction endonuclease subunit S [Saccharomonospora marina]EHR51650.1 restriction endonuclease S subunit [Saccharomonospora marina XMU15]